MKKIDCLILGAGISGLSASYHLGHDRCLILEKQNHAFGLLRSDMSNGFTWDMGPHVSFTKDEYVKDLFGRSVNGLFVEKVVDVGNYYRGHWVNHPVQTNLYQIPEPLRSACVDSFLKSYKEISTGDIKNYREWLIASLGEEITNNFVAPYTCKFWTVEPENMDIDWIGGRVHRPKLEAVIEGAKKKSDNYVHYINKIRYPQSGGFQSFGRQVFIGANIMEGCKVINIDLTKKIVRCKNGDTYSYNKLISTIPLPEFVRIIEDVSPELVDAVEHLSCSQLLLVNVEVDEVSNRPEDWLYVYDEDKYCTRINFTEKLSNNNAPKRKSGIQVEVYFSKYRLYTGNAKAIAQKVVRELLEMGIIEKEESALNAIANHRWIQYANIICDNERRDALDYVFDGLSRFGLARNSGDLDALTDWKKMADFRDGDLYLLGRFGEWKYYWSDDCVLAGKRLSGVL